MRVHACVTAVVLYACLVPPHALAQAPAANPTVPATFRSSVTESVDVAAQAVTTEHVDSTEIGARHARTLDEALTFIPGVRVRSGGDGRPVIDVRGLRPRHVLLLLDGVPLNATNDGQFDASLIPTEFLQDVTVTFGASSVLYGDGAIGGVMELTPASSQADLAADAGIDWRSGNQRDVSGRITRGTDRTYLLAAVRTFASDGFRLPHGAGIRGNSDSDQTTALGKVSFVLNDRWRIAGLFNIADGFYGIPPAVTDPFDRFGQRVRYERVEDYRTRASQLSWDYKGPARFSMRGWAFINQDRQQRVRYDSAAYNSIADETVAGTFQTHDASTVSGGSVHARYSLGRLGELKAGFNGRRETFISSGIIRDVELTATPTPGSGAGRGTGQNGGAGTSGGTRRFGLRSIDDHHAMNVVSGGLEWEGRPLPGVGLVVGYSINVQDANRSRTDPTLLAGMFTGWRGATIHAAAFQRMRFPSIADLYEAGSGNAALRPERSRGVEGGIERRVGTMRAAVNGFVMNTRDFIERSDDTTQYVNRDRYRIAGMDSSLGVPITSRVAVRGIYSFLSAIDRSTGSRRAQLQYQPRHRVALETGAAVTPTVHVLVTANAVGRQPYYSRTAPLEVRSLQPYVVSDLEITKDISRAALTIGMSNAFDVYRESPYGMPNAGRTLYVSLRARAGR